MSIFDFRKKYPFYHCYNFRFVKCAEVYVYMCNACQDIHMLICYEGKIKLILEEKEKLLVVTMESVGKGRIVVSRIWIPDSL